MELDELRSNTHFTLYARRGNLVAVLEGTTKTLQEHEAEVVRPTLREGEHFVVSDLLRYSGRVIAFDAEDLEYTLVANDSVSGYTFKWNHVTVSRRTVGTESFMIYDARGSGHRIDRRNAYRVPVYRNCTISLGEHRGTLDGTIVNVSTRGILLEVVKSSSLLSEGDYVGVQFTDTLQLSGEFLSKQVTFKLVAKIVRVSESPSGTVHYGCTLAEFDEDIVNKYVNQKQLYALKNKCRVAN